MVELQKYLMKSDYYTFLSTPLDELEIPIDAYKKKLIETIGYLKTLATVFLTMAMAAVGISINLSELKSMGYKPFVVGLIAAVTVGFISLIYIETLTKFI